MFEKLESLVRDHSKEDIMGSSDIPEEKKQAAIQAASSSIADTLKQKLTSGGLAGLPDIFKQGTGTQNPAVNDATATYVSKLHSMGINADAARKLASAIIPSVFAKLSQKVNDPNDKSLDVKDLMSSVSGASGSVNVKKDDSAPGAKNAGDNLADTLKGLF